MSTYAIGDTHGCLKTFQALLDRIALSKKDTLILLGDYIDRGPDSKGVIDLIWKLQKEAYDVKCLKGNHEQMLNRGIDDLEQTKLYHTETLKSFQANKIDDIPKEYLLWMTRLPFYLEWNKYIFVHAGLGFDIPMQDPFENKRAMLWTRNWYGHIDKEWLQDRIIIHGHTPTRCNEIEAMRDKIFSNQFLNLDSGCYYSTQGFEHLCCYHIEKNELLFQKNIDFD